MLFLAILTVITFTMTVRSVLIVLGAYKDPLLASFERYGEEKIYSPPVAVVIWVAIFTYISLYWYADSAMVFGIGMMIIIPITSLNGFLRELVIKYKNTLRSYPRWCYDLFQMTDREERRRIAYMWLFLPPSTRMLYNANNHLFRQWAEQVILTVAD